MHRAIWSSLELPGGAGSKCIADNMKCILISLDSCFTTLHGPRGHGWLVRSLKVKQHVTCIQRNKSQADLTLLPLPPEDSSSIVIGKMTVTSKFSTWATYYWGGKKHKAFSDTQERRYYITHMPLLRKRFRGILWLKSRTREGESPSILGRAKSNDNI